MIPHRHPLSGAIGPLSIVWLLCLTLAHAQAPTQKPQMAEEVFKNVQILKGIPVDEFMATMGFFAASTGLNCTDCHVEESGGDWARYADDNDRKRTSRRMIQMVTNLNRASFGGRQMVTCNTCHRGVKRPNVMPSLAQLYGTPPPDEPGDPFEQANGQPAADQVIDKFIQAIGGAPRVTALTSFAAKGTYLGFDDAEKRSLEILAKAPRQRTTITRSPAGVSTTVLNGASGWIAGLDTERPMPLIAITGQELEGVQLEADLMFPARLKQALGKWRVGFPMTIDDREVQLVQGTTAGGGTVTLCFDSQSGLLVRLVRFTESPVGRLVTQVDYSDYRDVAGVRMPFKWTVSWLNGRSVYELTEVQPNVAIDAARFGRPAQAR